MLLIPTTPISIVFGAVSRRLGTNMASSRPGLRMMSHKVGNAVRCMATLSNANSLKSTPSANSANSTSNASSLNSTSAKGPSSNVGSNTPPKHSTLVMHQQQVPDVPATKGSSVENFSVTSASQLGLYGFKPDLVDKACGHMTTPELLKTWGLLRAMRSPLLHKPAEWLLGVSTQDNGVGQAATVLVEPWLNQFCVVGDVDDAVEAIKEQGIDPKHAIMDYAEELITTEGQAGPTKYAYTRYLKHPEVQQIAVKMSGLIPPHIKRTHGMNHYLIGPTFDYLFRLGALAQRENKRIFVDAEYYATEHVAETMTLALMKEFPGVFYATFQATRKDSEDRIKEWATSFSSMHPMTIKLVKGAYSEDRDEHPHAFNATFDDTHDNYLRILDRAHKDPRISAIPCSHNEDIITAAAGYGFKEVGQLNGMQIASGITRDSQELVYVVAHPDRKKLVDYLWRRFAEHREALKPRREQMMAQALWQRANKVLLPGK